MPNHRRVTDTRSSSGITQHLLPLYPSPGVLTGVPQVAVASDENDLVKMRPGECPREDLFTFHDICVVPGMCVAGDGFQNKMTFTGHLHEAIASQTISLVRAAFKSQVGICIWNEDIHQHPKNDG